MPVCHQFINWASGKIPCTKGGNFMNVIVPVSFCYRFLTCALSFYKGLFCSWAYVSCQYEIHVHFPTQQQKACRAPHSFWKWGNGCDTSHSRVFRLWVWLVEVWNLRSTRKLCDPWNFKDVDTCLYVDTCPQLKHICVSRLKGGRRETTGWEKEKQSLNRGRNKWQHPKEDELTWHVSHDNACHL